ncbi:MAG: lipopolysaccharide kinase InaA family protein, partial [Planctomycetes bacterium]|nr:lipopolysaccharide kinase InaA family protein [Planctomycetota bacterium]
MLVEVSSDLLVPTSGTSSFDPRLTLQPEFRDRFATLGLTTPAAFFALPGEIVSGHPDRHVMRVKLEDGRFAFLKREHRIRTKQRWHNWRDGFGWVSRSVREGKMLRRLGQKGLPVPKWLAYGEDNEGRAFLLVDEVIGSEDLRRVLAKPADHRDLTVRLGRLCAELHEAGIDHPDLYAKHILLDRKTNAVTLLDWQRATIQSFVSWADRIRSLAALSATTSLANVSRKRFLWAYLRVVRDSRIGSVPSFAKLSR